LLSFLIFLIPGTVISQHYHFVYIQGENQQAFYMKKSGELISSSATGFVILPKLQAGTHQFTIGFPKNQWPEYEFQVEIKSSDRGFTLKNFDNKGWGLFDLQTLEVVMGKKIDPPKVQAVPETPKSNDPFAVILASAVGDEGIRETALVAMKFDKPAPVAARTSPAPSVTKAETVPDPPAAKTETISAPPAAKTETTSAPPLVKADDVSKPVQTETAKLPTIDQPKIVPKQEEVKLPEKPAEDTKDTAQHTTPPKPTEADSKPVIAPPVVKTPEPPVTKEEVKAAPALKSEPVMATIPPQVKTDSVVAAKTATGPTEQKNVYTLYRQIRKISEIRSWKTTELIFIDIVGSVSDTITVIIDDGVAEEPKQEVSTVPVPPPNRQDCKEMATEQDMLSLRKKVLRQKTEEDMLSLTIKDIRSKCYSVDMLQGTSYVFVTDKMRYSLLEQAYPFVYDPANYSKLERLLTTDEYINRFRDLIKSK
jgi:hypothetical protein